MWKKVLCMCISSTIRTVQQQEGSSRVLLCTDGFSITNLVWNFSNKIRISVAHHTKPLTKRERGKKGERNRISVPTRRKRLKQWQKAKRDKEKSTRLASRGLFWPPTCITNTSKRQCSLLLQRQTLDLQFCCLWSSEVGQVMLTLIHGKRIKEEEFPLK
jgi:hypothetical protein